MQQFINHKNFSNLKDMKKVFNRRVSVELLQGIESDDQMKFNLAGSLIKMLNMDTSNIDSYD